MAKKAKKKALAWGDNIPAHVTIAMLRSPRRPRWQVLFDAYLKARRKPPR